MRIANLHRWFGLGLFVPLLVWAVTGLLFQLKPGWSRAYEMLSMEQPLPETMPTVVGIDALLRAPAGAAPCAPRRVELLNTVLGLVYRVRGGACAGIFDAVTGRKRALGPAEFARIAEHIVATHPGYQRLPTPAVVAGDAASATLKFRDSITVTLGLQDWTLSQRGADTDRIDWWYRLHYLQWTGNRAVDRVVGMVGLGAIWVVTGAGLVLWWQRRRHRRGATTST